MDFGLGLNGLWWGRWQGFAGGGGREDRSQGEGPGPGAGGPAGYAGGGRSGGIGRRGSIRLLNLTGFPL
eukprot:scaffold18896_cov35-Prasinocladus_malaysianus.AAC.1